VKLLHNDYPASVGFGHTAPGRLDRIDATIEMTGREPTLSKLRRATSGIKA